MPAFDVAIVFIEGCRGCFAPTNTIQCGIKLGAAVTRAALSDVVALHKTAPTVSSDAALHGPPWSTSPCEAGQKAVDGQTSCQKRGEKYATCQNADVQLMPSP